MLLICKYNSIFTEVSALEKMWINECLRVSEWGETWAVMLCAVWLMCGTACLSDPTDTTLKPQFHLSSFTSNFIFLCAIPSSIEAQDVPHVHTDEFCTTISHSCVIMDRQESSMVMDTESGHLGFSHCCCCCCIHTIQAVGFNTT